jgi:hypothetical protein
MQCDTGGDSGRDDKPGQLSLVDHDGRRTRTDVGQAGFTRLARRQTATWCADVYAR